MIINRYYVDTLNRCLIRQSSHCHICKNSFRPWTTWHAARWWWPRPGSCSTSSSGKSSPTSSGSPACTSWRSELVLIKKLFMPRIVSFPLVWLMLCKKTHHIQRGSTGYIFVHNHSEHSRICIFSLVQVQQKNPAVKGVRPYCPLDPARARPGRSEGWRRSEQYWRLSKRTFSKQIRSTYLLSSALKIVKKGSDQNRSDPPVYCPQHWRLSKKDLFKIDRIPLST